MKTDRDIAETFEQDGYEVPDCLAYYAGVGGFAVERVSHPDHLWTILDRVHSNLMPNEEFDDANMTEEQREWLQLWLEKWMKDIEPYCVRLEPE